MLDLLIPGLMIVTACAALAKRQDVYGALLEGGLDGLKLLVTIVPALVVLLTAVHMLRASGAIELLTKWLSPVAAAVGIPAETLPLVLLRPISGSAGCWRGSDVRTWTGFPYWPHGRCDARQHGNDVLHHFGILRCRRR